MAFLSGNQLEIRLNYKMYAQNGFSRCGVPAFMNISKFVVEVFQDLGTATDV